MHPKSQTLLEEGITILREPFLRILCRNGLVTDQTVTTSKNYIRAV